jgi:hypothetical protein
LLPVFRRRPVLRKPRPPKAVPCRPKCSSFRALRHIRQATTAIPNYTCSETIDRQRQIPPSRRFQRLDLVKLEVAKVGRKELFAWQGAGKLDDKPISNYVGAGLIGDGIYSLFADDIFVNGAAVTKYRGKEQVQAREAVRVDYTVNPMRGNFTITAATGSAVVGYSGSFWVDPESLDLLRLEIAADDVPVQVGFRSVRMVIEYGAMKAGARNALLARNSQIETVKVSGEAAGTISSSQTAMNIPSSPAWYRKARSEPKTAANRRILRRRRLVRSCCRKTSR